MGQALKKRAFYAGLPILSHFSSKVKVKVKHSQCLSLTWKLLSVEYLGNALVHIWLENTLYKKIGSIDSI